MNSELAEKEFKVSDQGFVRYVDHLGSDDLIYRIATGTVKDATKRSTNRDLLRSMMRHNHGSSFEFGEIIVEVCCPFYVWRQMIRHRASPFLDETLMYNEPSINELSGRYSTVLDTIEHVSSEEWRKQSTANRQGSEGYFDKNIGRLMSEHQKSLFEDIKFFYDSLIKDGVAKEQARAVWPMAGYTKGFMKMDVRNWLHFSSLRLAKDAQVDTRKYAEIIGYEIVVKLFPICWEAFIDYQLEAVTFSRLECLILEGILNDKDYKGVYPEGMSKRERNEFENKIEKIKGM